MTWVVGLSGGIASGKSSIARILQQQGAEIIDADTHVAALIDVPCDSVETIAKTFGRQFLNNQGGVDRKRLRELVFKDQTAKKTLEEILHPHVQKNMLYALSIKLANPPKMIVLDIPLLAENWHTWNTYFQFSLMIDCDRTTQLYRCVQLRGMDTTVVENILQSQAQNHERLAFAERVIVNGMRINSEALKQQTISFWHQTLRRT